MEQTNNTEMAIPANGNGAMAEHDNRAARLKTINNKNGIQLTTMQEMIDFSTIVAQSGLAPRGLETPQKLFVALAMGSEVGLSPMQSVQNIGVINGRPSLYGSIALGLVRASGLLESIQEFIQDGNGSIIDIVKNDSPDDVMAVCVTKRKNGSEMRSTFSVGEAKAAQLWTKVGPWQQYKKNMMKYRARGTNLADNFSDVLKGIPTMEEQIGNDPILSDEEISRNSKASALQARIEEKLAAKKKKKGPQTQEENLTPAAKVEPTTEQSSVVAPEPSEVLCNPKLKAQIQAAALAVYADGAAKYLNQVFKGKELLSIPQVEVEMVLEHLQGEAEAIKQKTEEEATEPPITAEQKQKIERLAQILYPKDWQQKLTELRNRDNYDGFTESDGHQILEELQFEVDQLKKNATAANPQSSHGEPYGAPQQPTLTDEGALPLDEEFGE